MLKSECGADVTIKCGSTELKAHSAILSARSDFFRAALDGRWKVRFYTCFHVEIIG
jgi:hypothetical protein